MLFSNLVMAQTDTDSEINQLKNKLDALEDDIEKLNLKAEKNSQFYIGGSFSVNATNYSNQPQIFSLGDFELVIGKDYKNMQIASALIFNDENGAQLKTGFIDYHLYGGSISPRGRLFAEKGLHLQVGRFDIPFGNDWQYYQAYQRITITSPLTTEKIMDGGYNDVGMRLLWNNVWINTSGFVTRGIDKGYSHGGNSFGSRIGFTPFNNPYNLKNRQISIFETGASYIYDLDSSGKTAEHLASIDAESRIGFYSLQAEYYYRNKLAGTTMNGFNILNCVDFSSIINIPVKYYAGISKADIDVEKVTNDELNTRLTTGFNINIYNISFLKIEYIRSLEASKKVRDDEYFNENIFYGQLVITL